MKFERLRTAANEMYDLSMRSWGHHRRHNLQEAASIGCKVLADLLRDSEFEDDVRKLNRLRQENEREYREALDNLEEFLDLERQILVDRGVRQELVSELLREARYRVRSIGEPQMDYQALRDALMQIRISVCNVAYDMRDEERSRKIGKAAMNAVGGSAIITLNVTSDILTLTPATSAVSGAIGSSLISRGGR